MKTLVCYRLYLYLIFVYLVCFHGSGAGWGSRAKLQGRFRNILAAAEGDRRRIYVYDQAPARPFAGNKEHAVC